MCLRPLNIDFWAENGGLHVKIGKDFGDVGHVVRRDSGQKWLLVLVK